MSQPNMNQTLVYQPYYQQMAGMQPYTSPPRRRSSNTLFLKGIPTDMSRDELFGVMSEYGKVGHIYQRISDKGIAFVTFYDTRDAEAALAGLRDFCPRGRHVMVNMSFKPNANSPRDPAEYSPVVIVTPVNVNQRSKITYDHIGQSLSRYGDIKEIIFPDANNIEVEFFDYRASASAMKDSKKVYLGDIEVFVKQVFPHDISGPVVQNLMSYPTPAYYGVSAPYYPGSMTGPSAPGLPLSSKLNDDPKTKKDIDVPKIDTSKKNEDSSLTDYLEKLKKYMPSNNR